MVLLDIFILTLITYSHLYTYTDVQEDGNNYDKVYSLQELGDVPLATLGPFEGPQIGRQVGRHHILLSIIG